MMNVLLRTTHNLGLTSGVYHLDEYMLSEILNLGMGIALRLGDEPDIPDAFKTLESPCSQMFSLWPWSVQFVRLNAKNPRIG